jgi:hypothetical protein
VYEGLVLSTNQLSDMRQRFDQFRTKSTAFVHQLEFEELKLRLLAFVVAAEQRLQQWTVKYGRQEDVESMLRAYEVKINSTALNESFRIIEACFYKL